MISACAVSFRLWNTNGQLLKNTILKWCLLAMPQTKIFIFSSRPPLPPLPGVLQASIIPEAVRRLRYPCPQGLALHAQETHAGGKPL